MGRLLKDGGLLSDLDTTALAAYCVAFAKHVKAEAMLEGPLGYCPNCDPRKKTTEADQCLGAFHRFAEFGEVVKSRLGRVGPSPYVAIADKAMAQMMRLIGEFGMTPASRSRIPKEKTPDQPPRRTPPSVQPGEDPRDVLDWPVQAAKN